MLHVLVSGSSGPAGVLGQGTLYSHSASLHPDVSRCINGFRHFNAGSNPATEQHPVQVTSRYRHRDKLRLDESLGLYAEFTLPHLTLVGIEALSDRYKNLDRNGVKERKEARLSINFIHLLVYQRLNSLRLH